MTIKKTYNLLGNDIIKASLNINSTVRNFLTVQNEGNRSVKRNIDYYNLDMLIAVGYRTNEQDKKYISDFDKIIDECKSKK